MKCSLIICTYNWPQALSLVLSSVERQSILPDEVIVADDGSDKSTEEVINFFLETFPVPITHSWQEDIGCRIPHSRNRAIAKAKFEYIIMVDGDTVLHEDFVKDHKRFAKKSIYTQGSRVLLQSRFTKNILNNDFFNKPSFFSTDAKNKLNMLRIPIISLFIGLFKNQNIRRIRGCNFSIFKDDIFQVNGFNEEINTWGREDSEFVQRLFNIGINKQQLKFSGIQYHLYHNERTHNNSNNEFLKKTIRNKTHRCDSGIDRYLK